MKSTETSIIASIMSHLRLVSTFCIQCHVSVVEEQRGSERDWRAIVERRQKSRPCSTVFSLLNMTEPILPSRIGTCERKTRAFAFQPYDISLVRSTDRVLHSKKLAVTHQLGVRCIIKSTTFLRVLGVTVCKQLHCFMLRWHCSKNFELCVQVVETTYNKI